MISERILTKFLKNVVKRNLVLEKKPVVRFPLPKADHPYLLYVHIPFCESLCPYCSFNRFIFDESAAKAYYKQLRAEMRMIAELGYHFDAMYIGGGTPTILIDELIATIDLGRKLFGFNDISCETNPNHLTPQVAGKLKGLVKRLSVGIQSFDNGLLKQMRRYDKFGSGEDNLERIRQFAGEFPTLNIDMIFNFPSQTKEILQRDIDMIIASGANQVSYYPLMTASAIENCINSVIGRVDYTREVDFYKIITAGLDAVFQATSAWTFSRSDGKMIDEYIVEYEEYVGIGSGSFSYLDGALFVNSFSLNDYAQRIHCGIPSVMASRKFSHHDQMRYRFMMELFSLELDKNRFERDFCTPVEMGLWMETAFMKAVGGFDSSKNRKIRLTAKGQYLLLVMMREFFCGVDDVREQARQTLPEKERLNYLGIDSSGLLKKGSL